LVPGSDGDTELEICWNNRLDQTELTPADRSQQNSAVTRVSAALWWQEVGTATGGSEDSKLPTFRVYSLGPNRVSPLNLQRVYSQSKPGQPPSMSGCSEPSLLLWFNNKNNFF